jgi:hypothetical protein
MDGLYGTGRRQTQEVAFTACIRKIVTALNAMVRDYVPWQPSNA